MDHDSPRDHEDYDSAWKEALECFLPEAIAMFSPSLHARIDWHQPPTFLDKEFQDLVPGIGRSRRHVDKLVRLALKCSRYPRLLLHVEVESRRPSIAVLRRTTLRVRQYDYRIHDRYVLRPALAQDDAQVFVTVCSLVIFTRGAGPDRLTAEHQSIQNARPLRYRSLFLESWLARWPELRTLARSNPFGVIVMAQLLAQQHRRPQRMPAKLGLVRFLLELRYPSAQSSTLLRLIDWMLALPAEQENAYVRAVEDIKKESSMAYVTSFERVYTKRGIEIGLKQGEEIGLKEGERRAWSTALHDQLEQKFGSIPDWASQQIEQAETAQLRNWLRRIFAAKSPQALFNG